MKEIVLVIGGCRSGKSRYALKLAKQVPGDRRIFIATCVPKDKEMEMRVAHHKKGRDKSWSTNGTFLGSGEQVKPRGFVITYLAWDIKLETCVAIKEYLF